MVVDYNKGKIYRIINPTNETIYVGSTCQPLCRRLATHHHRGNGNKIVLIRECPCENMEQLRQHEQAVIEEHSDLLNEKRAYRSPEQRAEQQRGFREANKEALNERKREKYQANKEAINERQNEKIECPHCHCMISRSHLARHQLTKKCMAHQTQPDSASK